MGGKFPNRSFESSGASDKPFLLFCFYFWRCTWFQTEITPIRWIAMKFGADVHGAQRMNPNDFVQFLNFPLAPPSFPFPMTFPSASAVLFCAE